MHGFLNSQGEVIGVGIEFVVRSWVLPRLWEFEIVRGPRSF